jgi:hypothetical protein
MTFHAADHFDPKIYEIRSAGNPQRIRSYLLTAYRIREADPARSAPGTWPSELCDYQEFLDVHASQSKYYPAFDSQVNRELEGRTTCRWALEPKANPRRRRGVLKSRRNESCAFTILFPLLTAREGRPAERLPDA